MTIEITHIRFGSTKRTEDEIVSYKWKSLGDGKLKVSSKATLVKWVDEGGVAYVGSAGNRVVVAVVKPERGDPYLRTLADGRWTNNLLSLPTF